MSYILFLIYLAYSSLEGMELLGSQNQAAIPFTAEANQEEEMSHSFSL